MNNKCSRQVKYAETFVLLSQKLLTCLRCRKRYIILVSDVMIKEGLQSFIHSS